MVYYTNTLCVGLCSNAYKLICVKLGMMTDTAELYSLIPVFMTMTFIHDYQITRKTTSAIILSQCSQLIWIKLGMLLKHLDVMELEVVQCDMTNVQGRQPLQWFCWKQPWGVSLLSGVYQLMSLKFDMLTVDIITIARKRSCMYGECLLFESIFFLFIHECIIWINVMSHVCFWSAGYLAWQKL